MFTWIAARIGSVLGEYLVGGLLLALLAGSSYYSCKYAWYRCFEKPALEKQVKDLQDIAIQLRAENFRQAAELKDRETTLKIHARHSHEDQGLDEMVKDNDDPAMRNYFIKHGMLRGAPQGAAAPATAGRPRHKP